MDNEVYDVVVVGAGPAGATTARFAALAGRRVCLIERKKKVGTPVRCGEAVGVKGVTRTVAIDPRWVRARISRGFMVSPSGIRVAVGKVDEGCVVDRAVMDADLVRYAREAGADYLSGAAVQSVERIGTEYRCHIPGKTIAGRTVTLADGVESKAARGLGWKTELRADDLYTCAFGRITHAQVEPESVALYYGRNYAPGGYAWVFDRGENTANVGLGVVGAQSRPGLPLQLLKKFTEDHFPGAELRDVHCGGVPAARWMNPLVIDGAVLVGDAARQVNCISGGGIGFALYAGRLAGEALGEATVGETVEYSRIRQYQKRWAKNMGKTQAGTYGLKKLAATFEDSVLDSIASRLENKSRVSFLRVFLAAYARHPMQLLKGMRAFI